MSAPRRTTVWVEDLEGVRIGAISRDLISPVNDERLDLSDLFAFSVPSTSDKAALLAVDHVVEWKHKRFTISEIEEQRVGATTMVSVRCEALWYELGRDRYIGTFVLDGVTAQAGLEAILADTGWSSGPAHTGATVYSMEADDSTYLELLRTWAEITGTHLRWDMPVRQVLLQDTQGASLGLAFRYRRNLLGSRRRVKPPSITRLYPYGADELSIAGANGGAGYVEDLSFYTAQGVDLDATGPDGRTNRERLTRAVSLVNTSLVTDTALLSWAQARIAELAQPEVSYELNVINAAELSGLSEIVRVGDEVRVQDPAFDLDVRATVVRREEHPNEPALDRLELDTNRTVSPGSASVGRPNAGDQWYQFVGNVMADYPIRNDATYTVARIPLRFRDGGRYHTTVDLAFTGVGAAGGTLLVEVYDWTADTVVKSWTVPYSDGTTSRLTASFAKEVIQAGTKDLRLRLTVTASGGPAVDNGVDLVAEAYDPDGATESDPVSWWVMAQRAVRETPPAGDTSQAWAYNGQVVRTFVVPDNVTEITMTAAGGSGYSTTGGKGGRVTATVPVTPGETLYIGVGGEGNNTGGGGSFGGGDGGGPGGNTASGGGGCSAVWRNTPTWPPVPADLVLVAPGGGGAGDSIGLDDNGGDGAFFQGDDGLYRNHPVGSSSLAKGGTQYAGGAAGVGELGLAATAGSFLQGGDGATGSGGLTDYGGGGGGGFYGGGGGGGGAPTTSGGGAGGSGWVTPDAYDLLIEDGVIGADDGAVSFQWTAVL